MSEEKKAEFYKDYAYLGKRLTKDEKLVDAYIVVDAEKNRLAPEDKDAWFYHSKFAFAKRPKVGAVYRARFTDETKQSIYIESDYERYKGNVSDTLRAAYELEHRAAVALDEKRKLMNKDVSKDSLSKMTLAELREFIYSFSASKRRALLLIILEYLGI